MCTRDGYDNSMVHTYGVFAVLPCNTLARPLTMDMQHKESHCSMLRDRAVMLPDI